MANEHKSFALSKTGTKVFDIVILVLLGAGGIAAVILMGLHNKLDQENYQAGLVTSRVAPTGAELSVVSSKTAYAVGETFEASIVLSTHETNVVGVDVQLSYDPSIVQPAVANTSGKDVMERYLITQGSDFGSFLGFSNDTKNGVISFTALKLPDQTVLGKGKVAILKFKAVKAGDTTIKFKMDKGATTDSNVATAEGKDALEVVHDLSITVQ